MSLRHIKTADTFQDAGANALRTNFRKIERREWWLWFAAAIITLLLTVALASFLLPNSSSPQDFHALYVLPQAVRGLVALVFLRPRTACGRTNKAWKSCGDDEFGSRKEASATESSRV